MINNVVKNRDAGKILKYLVIIPPPPSKYSYISAKENCVCSGMRHVPELYFS